jgi:hypothetical protein
VKQVFTSREMGVHLGVKYAVASLVGRSIEGINFGIKASSAVPLLQEVGFRLNERIQGERMSATQQFAAFSSYVVLVQATTSQ